MVFGKLSENAILKRKDKLNRYLNDLLYMENLPRKIIADFLKPDLQVKVDSFKDVAYQAFKSLGGGETKRIQVKSIRLMDEMETFNFSELFTDQPDKEISFDEFYDLLQQTETSNKSNEKELPEFTHYEINDTEMEKCVKEGIFGMPLEEVIDSRKIKLIYQIINFLEDKEIDFIPKGSYKETLEISMKLLSDEKLDILNTDPLILALILKKFLFSLPDCILNTKFFLKFVKEAHHFDPQEVLENIMEFPKEKKDFIITLVGFFQRIILENDLSVNDMAFIFCPVFLRTDIIKSTDSQTFLENLFSMSFDSSHPDLWNTFYSPFYINKRTKPKGFKIDFEPNSPWIYYESCHKSKDLTPILETKKYFEPYLADEIPEIITYDKKECKSGTLEKLIFKLICESTKDHETFLLTYRSIITGEDLLKRLMMLYDFPPNLGQFSHFLSWFLIPIRLKLAQFLFSWIYNFYHDFREDVTLKLLLDQFIQKMSVTKMEMISEILKNQIYIQSHMRATFVNQQLKEIVKKSVYKTLSSSGDDFKKRVGSIAISNLSLYNQKTIYILQFRSIDLANQLTLISFGQFEYIRPKEFFQNGWTKDDREKVSPNIVSMIKRANIISKWVAYEILSCDFPKDRSQVISKYIKIAAYCRKLNNFNTLFEIIAGLNLNCVYRLKKTWALVPSEILSTFKSLEALIDSSSSYKVLRQEEFQKSPCIPYIGLFLTDMLFIEEGNKDILKSGLINWSKKVRQAKLFKEIQFYQSHPYSIPKEFELTRRLYRLEEHKMDELDKWSYEIEPRQNV